MQKARKLSRVNLKEKNNVKGNVTKSNKGITLIALVITIIILLILAGITINLTLAPDGIIKRAQDAGDEYKESQDRELTGLGKLENMINSISAEISGGNVKIPEGLKIGDTVTYVPTASTESKHIYDWKLEYCSSGNEDNAPQDDVTLKNTDSNYAVTEWRVFDIDEQTGKVTLISAEPTEGTVHLGGAQGYNNAVKMLNDACSALYGNESAGIKARSIKIEDIEDKITDEALNKAYALSETLMRTVAYKSQVPDAYSSSFSNYPTIYAKEKLSVIDGKKNDNGLDVSEQTELIERADDGAENGVISTASSIQPYNTMWVLVGDGTTEDSLLPATKYQFKNKDEVSYYDLIMPTEVSKYWVASRFVVAYSMRLLLLWVCS